MSFTTAASPNTHSYSGKTMAPLRRHPRNSRGGGNRYKLGSHLPHHGSVKLNRHPALSLTSPNYADLSEVSFHNKRQTPGGEIPSPLALGDRSGGVDDTADGPSELESNIQSIVDTLKSQIRIRPLKGLPPWSGIQPGAVYENYRNSPLKVKPLNPTANDIYSHDSVISR